MDPNACLEAILDDVRSILRYDDTAAPEVVRLCDHIEALHDWLRRGGFLPTDWQPKESPCRPSP